MPSMKSPIEVRDVHGVSFDVNDLTTLTTEDEVMAEAARIFAQVIHAETVVFSPQARETILTSWRSARQSLQ
jgi:hypothetical protein